MTKKNKLFALFFSLVASAFLANFVLAQDYGIEVVSNSLGNTLGSPGLDPRVFAARIIQVILSFLGLIALGLILYAGVVWMTSGGSEDKIDKAKSTLKNAVIGLFIILASWTITTYVIAKITGSVGSALDLTNFNYTRGTLSDSGFAAIGACSVDFVYPENNQKDVPRNTSILISFKESFSLNDLCVNNTGDTCTCGEANCNLINPQIIRIYKTDLGDACTSDSCPDVNSNVSDVALSVADGGKSLILSPLTYLGESTQNTKYSVKIGSDLRKVNGDSMFKGCSSANFSWGFEVSSRLDLTPPQIVYNSLFPKPDNEKDIFQRITPANQSQGSIEVLACPNTFRPSEILSVEPMPGAQAEAFPLNYQGPETEFMVQIWYSSGINQAFLFDGTGAYSYGTGEFNDQGVVDFSPYFIFKAPERAAGNVWRVTLRPETVADTLTIGNNIYSFASVAGGNNIVRPENCDASSQAGQIYAALSGHEEILVERMGTTVKLTAKVAGSSGNNIRLATNNTLALKIESFSGGSDFASDNQTVDKKDSPMNTVIQINFNEPVNPLRISGLASEVADYIRVTNYNNQSKKNGDSCVQDEDCLSYSCGSSKTCIGDYLPGKFLISNGYKTVEFVSDQECGVNGCGEKIYCLPANSHLAVELKAPDLKACQTDSDCLSLAPFSKCQDSDLGYKTCQNELNRNYPLSDASRNGTFDLALNSFDGNRDNYADGPKNYYNDNYVFDDSKNDGQRDNYRFSFYINDIINLTPPKIESISPSQNQREVNLAEPIKINWNTLMMNSTLRTGEKIVDTGKNKISHKLINLKSANLSGLGYWVTSDNIDTNNDGQPDKTISWIKHTPFLEALTYQAQVGSGVRDIYQNCFKPSDGDICSGVSVARPSCCFGQSTDKLDDNGNCF